MKPTSSPDRYRAFVSYDRGLPPRRDHVGSCTFCENQDRHFRDPVPGVDETPGFREFWVRTFPENVSVNELISVALAEGYRPAIDLEAEGFSKQFPLVQEERDI